MSKAKVKIFSLNTATAAVQTAIKSHQTAFSHLATAVATCMGALVANNHGQPMTDLAEGVAKYNREIRAFLGFINRQVIDGQEEGDKVDCFVAASKDKPFSIKSGSQARAIAYLFGGKLPETPEQEAKVIADLAAAFSKFVAEHTGGGSDKEEPTIAGYVSGLCKRAIKKVSDLAENADDATAKSVIKDLLALQERMERLAAKETLAKTETETPARKAG